MALNSENPLQTGNVLYNPITRFFIPRHKDKKKSPLVIPPNLEYLYQMITFDTSLKKIHRALFILAIFRKKPNRIYPLIFRFFIEIMKIGFEFITFYFEIG